MCGGYNRAAVRIYTLVDIQQYSTVRVVVVCGVVVVSRSLHVHSREQHNKVRCIYVKK